MFKKFTLIIFIATFLVSGCNQSIFTPNTKEQNNGQTSNGETINWQALGANYNPPSILGLVDEIGMYTGKNPKADGKVLINTDIKREFNKMGTDYRFSFMPKVAWYDFKSTAYEPTGEALHYMLFTWTGKFGTFPEKVPKYEAEARLRKLFAAPNNEYPLLTHQEYRKCVMFDGESYTLWPESYDASTMVYDLVDLSVRRDGDYTYYKATAHEYQFDLTDQGHKPEKNELFLFNKSKAIGKDNMTTLAKLLETGEITKADKSRTFIIEFRREGISTTPQIVSFDKILD